MLDAYHRMSPNVAIGEHQRPPQSVAGTFRRPLMRTGGYDPARTAPHFAHINPIISNPHPFVNTANPGVKRYNA